MFACLLPILTMLAACGTSEEDSALPPDVVEVPPLIQQMMDAQFPADGEIHVQSKGTISISPDTPVCEMWKAAPEQIGSGHYFGINSSDLFHPLGQSSGSQSGDRQVSAAEPVCREPGSVIIYGKKSDNRDGEPYKLVLAVWRGDPAQEGAAWVGGVERPDGQVPGVFGIASDTTGLPVGPSVAELSAGEDMRSLSDSFMSQLLSNETTE